MKEKKEEIHNLPTAVFTPRISKAFVIGTLTFDLHAVIICMGCVHRPIETCY